MHKDETLEANVEIINCHGKNAEKKIKACKQSLQQYLQTKTNSSDKIMALEVANRHGPHTEILSVVTEKIQPENWKTVKKNGKLKDIKKEFRNFFAGGRYTTGIIITSWKDDDDFLNFLSELGAELGHFERGVIMFQPVVSVRLIIDKDNPVKILGISSFES